MSEAVADSSLDCLACQANGATVLHRIEPYTIMQCPRCRLAWTIGVEMEPESFYDEDYFVGSEAAKGYADYLAMAAAMQRTNRARLRTLQRLAPRARSLLDVGCGPGFFVRHAADAGLRACGIEVSEFAAQYGRDELHVPVIQGLADEAHLGQLDGDFELITLWDVVEHLPAPDETLGLLAQRLAPGGVLALSTGDVASLAARISGPRWHLFNLPEHLWFFTVRSLRQLLARAGLRVVSVEREVCWFTARYLLERAWFTLGRQPRPNPGTGWLDRIHVPCSLLDIVTVHARRAFQ